MWIDSCKCIVTRFSTLGRTVPHLNYLSHIENCASKYPTLQNVIHNKSFYCNNIRLFSFFNFSYKNIENICWFWLNSKNLFVSSLVKVKKLIILNLFISHICVQRPIKRSKKFVVHSLEVSVVYTSPTIHVFVRRS